MLNMNIDGNNANIDINIENFRMIDSFNKDSYTGATTVLYGGKMLHAVIEKDVPVQGVIKKGSYISIMRGNGTSKINSVAVISSGLYDKVRRAYEHKR